MTKKEYWHPGYGSPFSIEDIRNADREEQKEIMKEWFRSNYEDPVENTPFESAEGGYMYIWGGPYYPREELETEFCSLVPDSLISELADELIAESIEWAGVPTKSEYDNILLSIIEETEFLANFRGSIESIRGLLAADIDSTLKQSLYKLLYANVITIMETYLSDALINTIMSNESYIRSFVENNDDFRNEKFSLAEIYTKKESLNDKVKTYLVELTYHNLPKIKAIYKCSLDIDFLENIADIYKAINKRHHIVHRNGIKQDGTIIEVAREDIEEIVEKINLLVSDVDRQIAEL